MKVLYIYGAVSTLRIVTFPSGSIGRGDRKQTQAPEECGHHDEQHDGEFPDSKALNREDTASISIHLVIYSMYSKPILRTV